MSFIPIAKLYFLITLVFLFSCLPSATRTEMYGHGAERTYRALRESGCFNMTATHHSSVVHPRGSSILKIILEGRSVMKRTYEAEAVDGNGIVISSPR